MNSSPIFCLKLFGSPSFVGKDGTLLTGRVVQRHRLALLALLALAPAQRVSRDKLLAYLWPESGAERGRNLLNVSTYVLRTALGEGALLSAAEDLRLNPEVVQSDVAAFEAALARGDHAHAVALYGGPFLDGFFLSEAPEFEHWAGQQRERLAGAYAKALEALAEVAERQGDLARAVEGWKARAAHDSYDSRVALRLMRALEASGNRAGALQHATVHQRLLQKEFGAEPDPEVLALAERLRREPVTPPPAAREPAETSAEPMTGPTDTPQEDPAVSAPAEALPAPPAHPTAAAAPEGRTTGRNRWRVAALLLTLVSLAAASWAVWSRGAEPERSIVVLPFLNMSPDGDNDYFSDGLTEEIISRLSAVPDLKVISRTSAMHYKGSGKSLRQIADELDVAHVLEGSVRQSNGRLRITAQLIDARADNHLWAENYDYALGDIFRVQEEIAQQVVRALEVELEERERRLLVR